MTSPPTFERPTGVYLVTFYFVVAGFLESIQKYRESTESYSLNPFAEHSIWTLGVDILVYLALAYLVWNLTAFGRLAALVFGYVVLGMYVGIVSYYWLASVEMRITPLFVFLAGLNLVAMPLVVGYLQPSRRKKLFQASLWDLLVDSD